MKKEEGELFIHDSDLYAYCPKTEGRYPNG